MTKLATILAIAVALLAPATASASETTSTSTSSAACCSYISGTCYFQDASNNWNRDAMYAAACLQRYSFWVNCCSSLRIVRLLSPDAIRFQQRYGVEPYVDSDWDPGHMSGSTCCWVPAGVLVTIRQ